MMVFLNGRLVPEEQAVVPVFDRGFLYGDGLFETLRVSSGRLFRWDQHWERLQAGAKGLGLKLPFGKDEMTVHARQLIQANAIDQGALRVTVTRGVGRRGYSPRGAEEPCCVMTAQALDRKGPNPVWRLKTVWGRHWRAGGLEQFKTCNKLAQILARAEAEAAGADEALLVAEDGTVTETSSGNLFWVRGGVVETPPVSAGILPGVTREAVLEVCEKLGITVREALVRREGLEGVEAMFGTLSTLGVVRVSSLDGEAVGEAEVVGRVATGYEDLVREETENLHLA